VLSTFFDFDFCGCLHGIFGSCPFKCLHAWQTGIMKDAMNNLFLLSNLPPTFIEWCNNKNALPSSCPKVNITESKLYNNKPKFEAIFATLL
jgi:hypothetical protein